MSEHEHQFAEEETPDGARILFPCLICGMAAADALLQAQAERDQALEALAAPPRPPAPPPEKAEDALSRVHDGDYAQTSSPPRSPQHAESEQTTKLATVDAEIETLSRSLCRVFEVNGPIYSKAERMREVRTMLIEAFRLGERRPTVWLIEVFQNWFTSLGQSKSGRHKLVNWDDCEALLARLGRAARPDAPVARPRCKRCGQPIEDGEPSQDETP